MLSKNTLPKFISIFITIISMLAGRYVTFIPAGSSEGNYRYSLTNVTANGTDGAGGFSFVGDGFGATTHYRVTASFDGGTTFYNIPSATAIQLELGLIMVSLQLMVLVKWKSLLLTVGLPTWQFWPDMVL